ncbi:Enterobacterial putative membrane protein [Paramixta manurensis]|uniref:Enterobacterial putative membrane protein n=1 Tax=Paramixta manurensis TaxID=2740817 RepID=A0A6M8UUU4_9GAMM|nr:Enterobacterial putative membrane protein [Erwiniaceae bacterium PD-1]
MKKYLLIVILIVVTAAAGWSWYLNSHPTTLVATHKMGEDGFISIILIKNPPLTDKGKLDWWRRNAAMIKEKYGIPTPSKSYGTFIIDVFDFSDGYKELEKYDRLCFDDMKTTKNCVEKKGIMTIRNSVEGEVWYRVESGLFIEKNGEFIKIKENIKIK